MYIQPKRRIPKSAGPPVDITTIGQANNGNIEIINIDTPVQQQDRMAVDEVLINGRRYRIPERVVVLDFWNKVQRRQMSHPKSVMHLCSVVIYVINCTVSGKPRRHCYRR